MFRRTFFTHILDLLFPPKCVFCRKLLGRGTHGVCARCQETLPRPGEVCFVPDGAECSACVSPLRYEGNVRKAFLRYKFGGAVQYAGVFGRLIAAAVREHLAGRYDLITWAPLAPKRKRQRGYDQAMLLALAAAVCLDDVAVDTLRKIVDTPAQSSLSGADARDANVRGAYGVPDPELVNGKRVLLIDDVITTGSTLSECARVLREAGAADVVCATLARAEKNQRPY